MKTINDLKEHLQSIINELEENYSGTEDLCIEHNTYWIQGNNYIATNKGFISISNPTGAQEYEEDE